MCRKLVVLALVLGLSSACYAEVIGDWENGADMEGWHSGWEGNGTQTIVTAPPETLTSGEHSLQVKWEIKYWVLQWDAGKTRSG
jgi:hypothetical protein